MAREGLIIKWHPYPAETAGLWDGVRYWVTVETENGRMTTEAWYRHAQFMSRHGSYGDAVRAWAPYDTPEPYMG